LFAVLILSAMTGCAAVALTAGGVAAGAGVNHTLNGIAYKTFKAPVRNLRVATLRTLKDLDMRVKEDAVTEEGWKIEATAADRNIGIELERLTRKATRMRVVVDEGQIFFKDSATATEIIVLTAERIPG
jgi:hypothetical protein